MSIIKIYRINRRMNMKKKEKIIGSIAIVIILILFLIIGYFITKPKHVQTNDIFVDSSGQKSQSSDKSEEVKSRDIEVEVKGEVRKPGVYILESGSRVKDVVDMAGGFTDSADTDSLILVKKLKDEDCIIIHKKGENANAPVSAVSGGIISVNSSSEGDDQIDINAASLEELDKIPGVGPVTAQKIIDYREKNGPFKSIEDLKKVGRIGDKTLEKIKDKIVVR